MGVISSYADLEPNRPPLMYCTPAAGATGCGRFGYYRGFSLINTSYLRLGGTAYPAFSGGTAGQALDATVAGALEMPVLTSGKSLYISEVNWGHAPGGGAVNTLGCHSDLASGLVLVDLLVATTNSTFDATLNTLQTVNTTALPRYTSGEGVEIVLVAGTAGGGSLVNPTFTVNYTNSQGSANSTTFTAYSYGGNGTGNGWFAALSGSPSTIHVPLGAGDTGVRSVQSIQSDASGATAGNTFGIWLVKRLRSFSMRSRRYGNNIGGFDRQSVQRLTGGAIPIATYGSSLPFLFLSSHGGGISGVNDTQVFEIQWVVK